MRYLPLRIPPFVALVVGGLSLCWSAYGLAQTPVEGPTDDLSHLKREEIHPKQIQTPFPVNAHTKTEQKLEFLSAEQMTAADRELAESNQTEIARRAELQGFHLGRDDSGRGSWGYEQAVCPVFPEHLILEYSRGESDGDVTLFSAVVPRGGEGHVRVIPVRRRGYSLWTPSSSNALTINDFNHMVKEGGTGLSPDWLTSGLCYAALAGGHVRAGLLPQRPEDEVYPLVAAAKLTVSEQNSGAEVRFADATPKVKAMDWVMSFDGKGRLLKVKHTASQELRERPVPGMAAEVAGRAH